MLQGAVWYNILAMDLPFTEEPLCQTHLGQIRTDRRAQGRKIIQEVGLLLVLSYLDGIPIAMSDCQDCL